MVGSVFIILFFLNSIEVAWSIEPNSSICVYHTKENESSTSLNEVFDSYPDVDIVKVCTLPYKTEVFTFHLASRIQVENGVAFFSLTQIFEYVSDEERNWNVKPPINVSPEDTKSIFMCHEISECLRHDATGFVLTKKVTLNEFSTLVAEWIGICNSSSLNKPNLKEISFYRRFSWAVRSFESNLKSCGDLQIMSFESKTTKSYNEVSYSFTIKSATKYWLIDFNFGIDGLQLTKITLISE